MARPRALLRRMWSPRVRLLLHAGAIVALVVTALLSSLAEDYFARGVATGAAYQPIPHTDGNPMGINTFLNEEPDPAVVERSLDMIQAAGFGTIRQVFGWFEIEPRPGVFVDSSGRSTWEKYDRIVELASARGIEIIARLEHPPAWARAGAAHPEIPGPPDRLSDYADFVSRVVSRYQGRVKYVQIWNEPNLEGEWGGGPIDPYAYVRLLEAGATAARRADPGIVVLLAGLAPTDQLGPQNLSDLLFLQRVYDFGGAPYFDIAAVMVYGYGYSPGDRRVGFARNNFSRPIQTREIMLRNGDGGTPVWAAEYGWVSLPDDWRGAPSPWGHSVSAEKQARYLVDGYLRAQREWPWMGMMAVWAFRFPRPADAPDQQGNPTRGFTIVEHDFTPRPAYTALQQAAPRIQRAWTGAYALGSAQRDAFARGEPLTLHIAGSRLDIVVSGSGTLSVSVDGGPDKPFSLSGSPGQEQQVTLSDGRAERAHDVTLTRAPSGDDTLAPTGYVVAREPGYARWFPHLNLALAILALGVVASLAWTLYRGAGRRGWSRSAPLGAPRIPS